MGKTVRKLGSLVLAFGLSGCYFGEKGAAKVRLTSPEKETCIAAMADKGGHMAVVLDTQSTEEDLWNYCHTYAEIKAHPECLHAVQDKMKTIGDPNMPQDMQRRIIFNETTSCMWGAYMGELRLKESQKNEASTTPRAVVLGAIGILGLLGVAYRRGYRQERTREERVRALSPDP